MVLLLSLVLLFIVLLIVDFSLGSKKYQSNAPAFHFKPTSGEYDLYTIGDTFFEAFFDSLKRATSHIDVMFFIVRNDDISKQMYRILKEKAESGVTVRFLVDRLGSNSLKKEIIKDLEASGVQFSYSHCPSFPYFFYKLNRRNHRKITVIDDEVGYVGGFNVGKEYLGKDPKLGPWRDYHLKITGKAVAQLAAVFQYDWKETTKNQDKPPKVKENIGQDSTSEGEESIQFVVTESGQLEDRLVEWMEYAQDEIYIGTPYFIPSNRMFQAILDALDRGIHIRLIVPKKADHPLVKPAAFPFLKKLHQLGGDIRLFDEGFYHPKVIMIDDQFCDIGTANFDMRSVFLNKEINTLILGDQAFIQNLRTLYLQDFSKGEPFTIRWVQKQPLHTKLSGIIAQLIKPLL